MNAFYEHHQHSIRFQYAGFDRILLNAVIQPFMQADRVIGFFRSCRNSYPVHKKRLLDIAAENQAWIEAQARHWGVPISADPEQRRDEFVEPLFARAKPDRIVAVIKAREPVSLWTAIGKTASSEAHLERKWRWVNQYNVYLNDAVLGPMFVRVCPYFPFTARVCLNVHDWLARQMKAHDIRFRQSGNAFLSCDDPAALQALSDSLSPQVMIDRVQKWLGYLTPFFTDRERHHLGCQHRLFVSQIEYARNLIFRNRATLDALQQRLLDVNREMGKPDTVRLIFGRRVTRSYRGKLQTTLEDSHLGNPLLRVQWKHSLIRLYVRDHLLARLELATNKVQEDFGIPKGIENLPRIAEKFQQLTDIFYNVQQDVLETFLDRGQLQILLEPTRTASGKRIPGLHFGHTRQLGLMRALVRLSHLVRGGEFTTAELYPQMLEALHCNSEQCGLGSLRYELSKLRAKQLVEKIPHSRRYRITPLGYRVCVLFLKLRDKLMAPLVAGFGRNDQPPLASSKITTLDRLYLGVTKALDRLAAHVGVLDAA